MRSAPHAQSFGAIALKDPAERGAIRFTPKARTGVEPRYLQRRAEPAIMQETEERGASAAQGLPRASYRHQPSLLLVGSSSV